MSAYVVTENHIIYVVTSALSRRINRGSYGRFSWVRSVEKYVTHHVLDHFDPVAVAEFATELWRENVKSVNYRYQNDPDELEHYTIDPKKLDNMLHAWEYDPVQVLKSIDCLEYQSCEHPEWETSVSHSFLNRLRREAIAALVGYSDAKWGAPETYEQMRARHNLSCGS